MGTAIIDIFTRSVAAQFMIAYIRGNLVEKSPTGVILENQGIGYFLHVTLNTYTEIQDQKECTLHTYMHVKNEGQSVSAFELYGFAKAEERSIFELLLSVSGIGASTARMMLSSMTADEVRHAVLTEDEGAIKAVKGIGPKTAKRLILELKDKLGKAGVEVQGTASGNYNTEALSALIALGFPRSQAEKAVRAVSKSNPQASSVEELIKLTLKSL